VEFQPPIRHYLTERVDTVWAVRRFQATGSQAQEPHLGCAAAAAAWPGSKTAMERAAPRRKSGAHQRPPMANAAPPAARSPVAKTPAAKSGGGTPAAAAGRPSAARSPTPRGRRSPVGQTSAKSRKRLASASPSASPAKRRLQLQVGAFPGSEELTWPVPVIQAAAAEPLPLHLHSLLPQLSRLGTSTWRHPVSNPGRRVCIPQAKGQEGSGGGGSGQDRARAGQAAAALPQLAHQRSPRAIRQPARRVSLFSLLRPCRTMSAYVKLSEILQTVASWCGLCPFCYGRAVPGTRKSNLNDSKAIAF